jgi:hypothetical protein
MYGSVTGVASHAKTWTRGGVFYNASDSPVVAQTKPTLAEVENWLSQVSDLFDRSLSNEGFVTPVTATKSANLLALEVERIVADLCDRANGLGRLVSDRALHIGYMKIISNDVSSWVTEGAIGFENDGVPRTQSNSNYIGGYSFPSQRDG